MQLPQWLGLTVIPVGLLGTICNGLVVLAIGTNRSSNHSFSLLTGSQSIFNGFSSMLFVLYVIPMIVFDSEFMKNHSHITGYLFLLSYGASIQTHSLITINRFCAVFLPIVYRKLFEEKWTKLAIIISFIIETTPSTIIFIILPCRCYYNEDVLGYDYTNSKLCWKNAFYFHMVKPMIMCIFNVLSDTITICRVRKIRRAQGQTKFQKKEIDFLKQSFGQAVYLMFCLPLSFIIPYLPPNQVTLFIVNMFFWTTIPAFDGALTLYFNMEIRKLLSKKYKLGSPSNSAVVIGARSSTIRN